MLAKLRGAYVAVLGTLQPQKHAAKLRGAYVPVLGTLQPKKHAAVLPADMRGLVARLNATCNVETLPSIKHDLPASAVLAWGPDERLATFRCRLLMGKISLASISGHRRQSVLACRGLVHKKIENVFSENFAILNP